MFETFDTLTKEREDLVEGFWCFTCDAQQKGKDDGKCPICDSPLAKVWLKSMLNIERLSYIGILILLASVQILLLVLFMDKLVVPMAVSVVFMTVLVFSVLIICSYGLVFTIGNYFGMPSGKALFVQLVPSKYPEGKSREFSFRRLRMESVKSLGILAAGIFIFLIVTLLRSCTGQ